MKYMYERTLKMWKRRNTDYLQNPFFLQALPNDKILDLTKFESICGRQNKCRSNDDFCL